MVVMLARLEYSTVFVTFRNASRHGVRGICAADVTAAMASMWSIIHREMKQLLEFTPCITVFAVAHRECYCLNRGRQLEALNAPGHFKVDDGYRYYENIIKLEELYEFMLGFVAIFSFTS